MSERLPLAVIGTAGEFLDWCYEHGIDPRERDVMWIGNRRQAEGYRFRGHEWIGNPLHPDEHYEAREVVIRNTVPEPPSSPTAGREEGGRPCLMKRRGSTNWRRP